MLCVTQIVSWGVLYYAFPVLAPAITTSTGWPPGTVTAVFSAGLVTAALAGVPVGWLLDRLGPRPVMTAGSLLAVPAVVAAATARTPGGFAAAWVVAGVAMAAVLYPPAFAALTRWWGPRRVTALTTLTLVAGLSSTVFAPLTAALAARMDWRQTYLVLAVLLAAVTIPAHALGLRGRWPPPPGTRPHTVAASPPQLRRTPWPWRTARSRAFVLLAVAMGLASFAAFAVVVNLVPLLTGRGLSTNTAAWALGLGGVGQVCGRLGYGRLTAATSVRTRTVLVLGAGAATIALLAVLPGPAALLLAVAVLVGALRGMLTLVQATAVSDRWGATHYGTLNGLLSAPVQVAIAIAPWAGTALATTLGGYPAAFGIFAAAGGLAAVLATATIPPREDHLSPSKVATIDPS